MRIVDIEHKSGIETIVIIDNEDGSETSMLKEIYDRQQAEQSTPIVIDETSTK